MRENNTLPNMLSNYPFITSYHTADHYATRVGIKKIVHLRSSLNNLFILCLHLVSRYKET